MQGLSLTDGRISLGLTAASNSLTIDGGETTEVRIRRLISENPVVIFSRSSCCMCHVMKSLFLFVGVHPVVIELDEDEIPVLSSTVDGAFVFDGAPTLFVGGDWMGGLENLVALHLKGQLVPKLVQAGATTI